MRTPRPFSTGASWILVGIASVAFLGSAAVPAAVAATVEASAEGTLSIDTDPAGALAYVDGEPQGSTPVSVGGLPPGDHRIRVVKDGYLENSRVVNVRAGQANAVQVRLTTVSSSSPGPVLLEGGGQGKGGGGSKKWILIGAGAVAAGAAAYFVTHRNEPPTPGTVAVSTANALMSATEVTFTSQGASDPDKDPLTYAWDFGDGGQATGQGVMHVYRSAGTFTAKVSVSDGKKSVSATAAPVVVRSMQGGWRGVFNFSNIAVFDLTQTDTTIGGAYVSHTWANSDFSTQGPTIVGGSRVSAPRRVVIQTLIPTNFRGAFFGTYTVAYACDLNDALTSCEGSASGRNGNPFFHVFAMSRQ